MVVDYSKSSLLKKTQGKAQSKWIFRLKKRKLLKHFGMFEKYVKYIQLKQLFPVREDICCCAMEFVYITIPMVPKELNQLPSEKIQKKLLSVLTRSPVAAGDVVVTATEKMKNIEMEYRLLAVQPELERYVLPIMAGCEDEDEVYIIMANRMIDKILSNGDLFKGDARLVFLDDGTRNVQYYISTLAKDWNYVVVCSNRHEELELLYREFYEEEGLMIQCADYEKARRGQGLTQSNGNERQSVQKNIVVDLTSDWKGIHRIYPPGSYVLDVTFSHEKEEYLEAKGARLEKYYQVCSVPKEKHLEKY